MSRREIVRWWVTELVTVVVVLVGGIVWWGMRGSWVIVFVLVLGWLIHLSPDQWRQLVGRRPPAEHDSFDHEPERRVNQPPPPAF